MKKKNGGTAVLEATGPVAETLLKVDSTAQEARTTLEQLFSANRAKAKELQGELDQIATRMRAFGLPVPGDVEPKTRGRKPGSKNKAKTENEKVDGRSRGGVNKTDIVRQAMKTSKGKLSADDVYNLLDGETVSRTEMITALQAMRRSGEVKAHGKARKFKYEYAA